MTCSIRSKPMAGAERVAPIVLAVGLAVALAGCNTMQPAQPTQMTAALAVAAAGAGADRRTALAWAERYRANPNDPEAVVNYARALRAYGQRAQAVAVLEQASIQHPKDRGLLGAYGRALAEVGNYKRALDVLDHAHTPADPDWRILSAQGAALDQMGRHDEAQRYYATALRIAPDEPSVLSNLGLSYALSKDLVRAEATLRRAAVQSRVDSRVRENLALRHRFAGANRARRRPRACRSASGRSQRRLSAAGPGPAEWLERAARIGKAGRDGGGKLIIAG